MLPDSPQPDPPLTVQDLLDSLDDDLMVVDGAGRVISTGRRGAARLGLTDKAQALGCDPFALLPPDVATGRRSALARVVACCVAETLEDRHDGHWWSVRMIPLIERAAAGRPESRAEDRLARAVILRIRDVTGTRALALALGDSEERFRGTFDAAGHGMALIDTEGHFRMVNPMLRALLGIDAAHPGDLAAVVFPGDIKIAIDMIRRLAAEIEPSLTVRLRFVGADGATVWGLVSATLQRPRVGERAYVVMHLRDITQEQLAEGRLRAAKEEADRASRAKTRFLAAASHDLRQPLQALNMFISVLAGRENDPWRAAIIGKIEKTADALTALLDTLLDISKLDAGLMRCEPRDVMIGGLLARLSEEFQPLAVSRGLALRAVASSAAVHADPALVEIVLRNFLGNALRYTPSGRVLVGARRRGDGVEIQVLDTGPGIAPEQHGLIFEDFHQVENPAREKGEGLGLGLAIVKRVALLLGARVGVRSLPGRGSCFTIRLPGPQGRAIERPEDGLLGVSAQAARGLTVLLIDDDPAVLDGLTLVLEAWDCEVLAFADLDGLREGLGSGGFLAAPDVILSDFRLGKGENGVEAVRLVRDHFAQAVPALLLTGDTAPQRLREADASGLPLLHKPVKPEVLRGALADVIAGGLTLDDGLPGGEGADPRAVGPPGGG
ncbi:PAS domain-containing hybrid sensor histidine kinase/response regulator, partial [Rhodospirillum rubrum]